MGASKVVPDHWERLKTGPERDLAQQALDRRKTNGGRAAFLFVLVDRGDEWAVECGAVGGAVSGMESEQFREMLHASVDTLFDTADRLPIAGDA